MTLMSSLDMPKFNGCNLIFKYRLYMYTRDYGCFAYLKSRIFFKVEIQPVLLHTRRHTDLKQQQRNIVMGADPVGDPEVRVNLPNQRGWVAKH